VTIKQERSHVLTGPCSVRFEPPQQHRLIRIHVWNRLALRTHCDDVTRVSGFAYQRSGRDVHRGIRLGDQATDSRLSRSVHTTDEDNGLTHEYVRTA
jgi:hypothetical protein